MATPRKQSFPLLEPNLSEAFGLTRLRPPHPVLSEWLSAKGSISKEDQYLLDKILIKIIDSADYWNEEELKMQFISFIVFLAEFDAPICTYYDREISEMIGDYFLLCKSDMMLSKGIGELIKTPYFFMHEYKREKKYSGDPIGQMLGGMLIGQAKNKNDKPMYGCYVQGRFWFFSILIGKEYVVSKSFDASEMDDAKQIIYILRKLKMIILERLMA
jgi:hypothetical protein